MNSFALSRTSKGEITNLEISGFFFKKSMCSTTIFFSGIGQFTDNKPVSDETLVSVQSWTTFFCSFSLPWPFHKNFFPVCIPKIYGVMNELYISSLGSYSFAMTANVKCKWLCVVKKRKKNLYDPFLWMGSKATFRRQFSFYH